ncbi:MAG: hypothetical protein L6R36_009474 [Xanthoria steineri]|nr:MAG: hypothetical protein L6R36_009474 [Xanthoria steineri]
MERDPRLLFQAFLFPAQQPHDFWTRRMSKPGVYHPTRWEFLRLLERDRRGDDGDWLVCSECFTLHPKRMFAPYRESIVPWLRHYYEARDSDSRTCRHGRGLRSRPAFNPSGIVELCPCVKMTMSKKRLMEAWLRQKQRRSKKPGPAADFWWHECRHVYGTIEIETKIGLFLYDGTERRRYTDRCVSVGTNISRRPPRVGELGVLLEYRHRYPSSSPESNRSPRRLCPHHNLHGAIQELLRCGATHPKPGQVCLECGDIQYCLYCRTKVLDLRQSEDTAIGLVECSYRVERCLDGAEWPMHTMFPFARRQMPLLHFGPRRYEL